MVSKYLAALVFVAAALAAPSNEISKRQSISPLSSGQIASFTPYSYYAATGYCNPSVTKTWTCGANCEANPGFKPTASGGDGSSVQFWYVGFDPALNTVIVAHQGTDVKQFQAVLTDANVPLEGLDSNLFPGVPSGVQAHTGFADEHAKSAADILAAVKSTMADNNTKSVTCVGHSLGAAISLLDSIYLPLQIPGLKVNFYGYGLPRVGNGDFANYVDANIGSFTRITNLKDPVPIIPGRFLGYAHPSNEVHISENGDWDSCPGQDNTSNLCSIGDTPNIFDSDVTNHEGPYNGIELRC